MVKAEFGVCRGAAVAAAALSTMLCTCGWGAPPTGYAAPASDRGGPALAGGLQWIQRVFPRTIRFAPEPSWPLPTVLFITNYGGVDTVHELARRFPMDVLHFWGNDMEDRDRFLALLGSRERLDCIVMSRFKTKSIPADLQYEILRRVAAGTGFVMVDDFDRSETLQPRFLELRPVEKGQRVFAGIPYEGLRQWVHDDQLVVPVMNFWQTRQLPLDPVVKPFAFQEVSIAPFGQGSTIWIATGTHWARLGRAGRTLLPHIAQRRDMWVETDYYYSHTAKAIRRACGIEPPAEMTEFRLQETPPAILVGGRTALPSGGTLRWQLRDTWGVVCRHGAEAVAWGAAESLVALTDLEFSDAGRYFLDAWLLDADGRTLDWGSGYREVERGVPPCALVAAHPEGTPRGEDLAGVARVPPGNGARRLRLSLVDRHWREVGVQETAVTGPTVSFGFPAAGLDGQVWTVHADLLDAAGHILSRSFLTVTSPHTPATRGGFHPLMTCSDAQGPEEAARVEYLRQLGFLSNRPYSGGSPIMAECLAWCDVQLFPFSFRITGASDDVNGEHICDWSAPLVRQGLAQVHRRMVELYRPFGLRGFNLTDDSAASRELPLGPYTTIAFHDWLRREYGGVRETAAAWGLKTDGFGRVHSFGRIHKAAVKAWYEAGNTAPWIDAQRFLLEHWVETIGHVRDTVREVCPEARVGSDAAYYGDAMAQVFDRVEYLAPYYRDYAVKVAVARGRMRRDGDYGACLGSYGDKPARMTGRRGQIWSVLFAGGTGLYYWSFHVGLREDLTLHDAHALYQCEAVEEVMSGIGELFTSARRLYDPIAILDSASSGLCDELEKQGEPLTSKANSIRAFQHVLEDAGLNPWTVTGRELTDGYLQEHGIALLVLPGCNSLSDAEIAAVQAFAEAGGVVVADVRPGLRRANGTLRQHGPLDAMFGIAVVPKTTTVRARGVLRGTAFDDGGSAWVFGPTLCDPRLRAGGAESHGLLSDDAASEPLAYALFEHKHGAGRAYLFNASFSSYDTFRSEGGAIWEPWFRVVTAVTERAGLSPRFRGTSGGQETPGLEFSPFAYGSAWLLGVEDLGCGDVVGAVRPFEVSLPREAHMYDVRAGRYLGAGRRLEDEIPRGGHRAYALLPYRVRRLVLSAAKEVFAPGELLRLRVRLETDVSGDLADHVIRTNVRGPDGGEFLPFRRVVHLGSRGETDVFLRTAANDPQGPWRVLVTDVATGTTATLEVTLVAEDRQ